MVTHVTTVARFEIAYTRYLDEHGQAVAALPDPFNRDATALIPLYRAMVQVRSVDAKAVALQRTGQLGTYASSLGQEAVGVAVGSAMAPQDVLFPTYRETGAQLCRGVTMVELLRYWSGDEQGNDFAGPREDFPACITIAAQACHAAGVAAAFKLRRQPRVAVTVMGDGATSKGDFYEALNLAGAWQLPLVFVIINNHWAISVPRAAQSGAETLAQKAIAAGLPGQQVDGNDMVAMYSVFQRALESARTGGGPQLIEAMSYRLHDHTTADDARRYRDPEEVSRHWAFEPVVRLRNFLVNAGVWSKEDEERLLAECSAQVQQAVDAYLKLPAPAPETMFDCLYAALPASLASQRQELLRWSRRHG